MNRTQAIERGRRILIEHSVQFQFENDSEGGWAAAGDNKVGIGIRNKNPTEIASTVLHELSHVLCCRAGKYYDYNNYREGSRATVKMAKKIIRTGLRAERYVDKMAARLMKKYYPGLKYEALYKQEWAVIWYNKNFLKFYRDLIERNT